MQRSPIQQRHVETKVGDALFRAGLRYDHPIRRMLEEEVEIVGPPGKGYFCIRVGEGKSLSIDDRIKELRVDPDFRAWFPDRPKVARGDQEKIRENLERIASGDVEVIR